MVGVRTISDEVIAELVRAYVAGDSVMAVGRRLGIKGGSVYYWVYKLAPDVARKRVAVRRVNGAMRKAKAIETRALPKPKRVAPFIMPPLPVAESTFIRALSRSELMTGRRLREESCPEMTA